MSCQKYSDWIDPYLDGELDSSSAAGFEQHLAGCPDCQHELAQVRAIFTILDSLQDEPAPSHLSRQVMAGLPVGAGAPWLRWVLAGQVVATAGLLLLAYPTLAAWSAQAGQWLEPGWLSNLVRTAGHRLGELWGAAASTLALVDVWALPQGLDLNLTQAAVAAVVLAGMWFAGNRLLFAQSNQTGGTR
jgi:hypothetical protein